MTPTTGAPQLRVVPPQPRVGPYPDPGICVPRIFAVIRLPRVGPPTARHIVPTDDAIVDACAPTSPLFGKILSTLGTDPSRL